MVECPLHSGDNLLAGLQFDLLPSDDSLLENENELHNDEQPNNTLSTAVNESSTILLAGIKDQIYLRSIGCISLNNIRRPTLGESADLQTARG